MGLIRKSLAVGTVGLVNPNSKKQRNQKTMIKEQQRGNELAAAQLRVQQLQAQLAAQQVGYSVPAAQRLPLPGGIPAGWYPDPHGAHQLRWWDGGQWLDNYAPMTTTQSANPRIQAMNDVTARMRAGQISPTEAMAQIEAIRAQR